jgi:hypothetical protein
MLNLLKRTMTYPGFKSGTFRLAVSIANHYTSTPFGYKNLKKSTNPKVLGLISG